MATLFLILLIGLLQVSINYNILKESILYIHNLIYLHYIIAEKKSFDDTLDGHSINNFNIGIRFYGD